MAATAVYLDSSAIVKLAVREPESESLRRHLRRRRVWVSSAIARTEVLRVLMAAGADALHGGREILSKCDLVRVNDRVLNAAGTLQPNELRSLDAIHLATAQLIGPDLIELVTYDDRMADAARMLGHRVASPARPLAAATTVPQMQIRRRAIASIVLVALVACGDDDDRADTTGPAAATEAPSTTAAATTAAATTVLTGSDAELAQSALLTIDDMPSGWIESPNDDDDEQDAETIQLISDCSGLDAALIGDEVLGDSKAQSPELQSPDELASVKHTLGFAADEATATAAMTEIGDDALAPCYEEAMRTTFEEAAVTTDPEDSLPEGMTLADITMERIDPPVTVGADDAVWYSATATLDFQGQQIEIYVDLLFSRTGRVLSQIEFDGTRTPFPEDLYEPTISAAQGKVDAIPSA